MKKEPKILYHPAIPKSRRITKEDVHDFIRIRMRYLEYVEKSPMFTVFSEYDAWKSLKKMKKKYPYLWRTRNKGKKK